LNEANAFATSRRFKTPKLYLASTNKKIVSLYLKMEIRRTKKVKIGMTQYLLRIKDWWSLELNL